jgi:hypothetical protein
MSTETAREPGALGMPNSSIAMVKVGHALAAMAGRIGGSADRVNLGIKSSHECRFYESNLRDRGVRRATRADS